MDYELIIREKKSLIIETHLMGITEIAIALFLYDSAKQRMDYLLIYIIGVVIALGFWIIMGLDVHLRYLKISKSECVYRTMFGKIRRFQLNEIQAVCPTEESKIKGWSLLGKNREILAKIEDNMQNAERLIPYLKVQEQMGNWNGQILKEYEANKFGKKNQTEYMREPTFMPDTMIIRPNKRIYEATAMYVLCLVVGAALIIWGMVDVMMDDRQIFIAIGIVSAFAGGMGVIAFGSIETKKYKNLCLTLTSDICTYIDQDGNKTVFLFENIDDVKAKVIRSGKHATTYWEICIIGRSSILIENNLKMDNAMNLQEFVRFHKENAMNKKEGEHHVKYE